MGEMLTTRPAIWVVGFAVGLTFLVLTSLVGPLLGVLVTIPLVIAVTAGVILKDRVMIIRRRILLTRQPAARRQFVAAALSASAVAVVTAAFGWVLGDFMRSGYDDQVRRYLNRKPKPQK
jgi:hypothetical protein